MNSKKFNVLTSFWFIACLVILLLNDFVLKGIFHNWITGKLSDFAGLFVFSIFFASFFKYKRWVVFVLTAVFFVFWKSPFSNSLISFWNSSAFFTIQRVVDYTDLIALSVLIPAYFYQKKQFSSFAITAVKYGVVAISIFAFMATSRPDDGINPSIFLSENYSIPLDKDIVRNRLETLDNINYVEDFTNEFDTTFALIFIETETCVGRFEYTFSFSENEDGDTDLNLFEVFLSCEGQSFTEEELIALFETEVIEQIN